MQVERVFVQDTLEGRVPELFVDRDIRQDFVGKWTSSVKRLTGTGLEAIPDCISSGTAVYQTSSKLPVPLTLDWWL
ncbi:MAG: hypothetical protein ACRCXM_11775 [Beijerinckiaceae bacterium]